MKILVIGGGIGGLTAANVLGQAGFAVEVFERAPELKEVGAGIGLSANAIRVLQRLGLMRQIVDQGTVLEAATTYSAKGQVLLRLPMQLSDPPGICLHRADLQQALLSGLPPSRVHLGETFVRYQQSDSGITAHFASGRTASGDALIGADGLRSKVRAQLLGDGEPVYRGYQCWRGVCSQPPDGVLTETLGRGLRVGVVPLGRRGTAWWCCANEPEYACDGPDGAKSKLLHWVGHWHEPIPSVIGLTDPESIFKIGIYDRPPVRPWSEGCCALLGDAAHPTTPNLAQGGCMAMEDAVVLTRCLSKWSDPATAFGVYERLRRGRTATVTLISRYAGVMGQWSNPGAVALRNALFRLTPGTLAARNFLKFVGYDPYQVTLPGS